MNQKKIWTTKKLTITAILSATSFIFAFIEFPIPLSPSFARMDISDFPALMGSFIFGPIIGLLIELIKNILQLFSSSTAGIGELANFLMGSSFVVSAGFIYKKNQTKKTAIVACIVSSLVMGIVAALTNYYILLPLFVTFMPLDQLIDSFHQFLPFIHTKLDIVLYNAFPFNLLKGLCISLLTFFIYSHLERTILK